MLTNKRFSDGRAQSHTHTLLASSMLTPAEPRDGQLLQEGERAASPDRLARGSVQASRVVRGLASAGEMRELEKATLTSRTMP